MNYTGIEAVDGSDLGEFFQNCDRLVAKAPTADESITKMIPVQVLKTVHFLLYL
jgi:hypothetical protein